MSRHKLQPGMSKKNPHIVDKSMNLATQCTCYLLSGVLPGSWIYYPKSVDFFGGGGGGQKIFCGWIKAKSIAQLIFVKFLSKIMSLYLM